MKLPLSPLWVPAVIAAVMLIDTAIGAAPQPIVDRNPRQMCEEVKHELLIQVEEGMIDRKDADRIIGRCFRIFVDAK